MKQLFPNLIDEIISDDDLISPFHHVTKYASRFTAYANIKSSASNAWDKFEIGTDMEHEDLISDIFIDYYDYLRGIDRYFFYHGKVLAFREFCFGELVASSQLKCSLADNLKEFLASPYAVRQREKAIYAIKLASFLVNTNALRDYLLLISRQYQSLRYLYVIAGYELTAAEFKRFDDGFQSNERFITDLYGSLNALYLETDNNPKICLCDCVIPPDNVQVSNFLKIYENHIAELERAGATADELSSEKHLKEQIIKYIKRS